MTEATEYRYQVVQMSCNNYRPGEWNIYSTHNWRVPLENEAQARAELHRCSFPGYIQRVTVHGVTAGVTYKKRGEQYEARYREARLQSGRDQYGAKAVAFTTERFHAQDHGAEVIKITHERGWRRQTTYKKARITPASLARIDKIITGEGWYKRTRKGFTWAPGEYTPPVTEHFYFPDMAQAD